MHFYALACTATICAGMRCWSAPPEHQADLEQTTARRQAGRQDVAALFCLGLRCGDPGGHALLAGPGAPAGQQRGPVVGRRLRLRLGGLLGGKVGCHVVARKCARHELPLAQLHACTQTTLGRSEHNRVARRQLRVSMLDCTLADHGNWPEHLTSHGLHDHLIAIGLIDAARCGGCAARARRRAGRLRRGGRAVAPGLPVTPYGL